MQSPMKLSIDITDKTAVAAAIPLLQLLLGYSFTAAAEAGMPVTVHDAAAAFSTPAQLPAGAGPLAFVPPGAGAGLPSIAPGVPPGTFQPPNGQAAFVPPGAGQAAPSGAAAGQTPPASNVELDSEGLPWDERIHAGTKTKTVPGAWKAKKGVDAALVASVKAELRARMAANGQAPAPTTPAPAAGAVQQQAAGGLPPLGAPPFVPPGAFSQSVPQVAHSAPVVPTTFEDFMPRITAACAAGIVPMEAVNATVAAYGLPSITSLQQNPSYVSNVWQYLQQQYPALV